MITTGTSLLHYRFTEKLGEGGMGAAWKAIDATLDRDAKVLASLNHPNIGAIYGFQEAGGIRFLAMELVAGEDLSKRLKQGRSPDRRTIYHGAQQTEDRPATVTTPVCSANDLHVLLAHGSRR